MAKESFGKSLTIWKCSDVAKHHAYASSAIQKLHSFHLFLSQTSFRADGPWLFTKFTKPWHIAAVSDQVSSSMRIIFHVQDIRFLVNLSCEPPPVSVHPSSPDLQRGALTAARGTGRVTNVVSAATSPHQRPPISVQYYPTLASTDFYHCSQL